VHGANSDKRILFQRNTVAAIYRHRSPWKFRSNKNSNFNVISGSTEKFQNLRELCIRMGARGLMAKNLQHLISHLESNIMSFKEMIFDLLDSSFTNLGVVSIESLENEVCRGKFSPSSLFEKYKNIFLEYEMLVESQQFSAIDKMELNIAGLGFFVVPVGHEGPARAISDLQIMKDGISFKVAFQG